MFEPKVMCHSCSRVVLEADADIDVVDHAAHDANVGALGPSVGGASNPQSNL